MTPWVKAQSPRLWGGVCYKEAAEQGPSATPLLGTVGFFRERQSPLPPPVHPLIATYLLLFAPRLTPEHVFPHPYKPLINKLKRHFIWQGLTFLLRVGIYRYQQQQSSQRLFHQHQRVYSRSFVKKNELL